MSVLQLKTLLRRIGPVAGSSPAVTDSDLLDAFCRHHGSLAFAEIVHRHGTMVLRVCLRVLGNLHDAEDAFQATFITLALKANTLRNRSSLGSFLHGVAFRTAQNLLRTKRRQQSRETWVATEQLPQREQDYRWCDVQAVLDEEIQKLPALYRSVFIHCCLEGQSRAETAKLLGVREGTLSSRLTYAKKLLQVRLKRRGISLGTLLGALSLNMVSASQSLQTRTAMGAVELAAGRLGTEIPAHVIALARQVPATSFLYRPLSVLIFLLAIGAGIAWAMKPTLPREETSESLVPDPVNPKANVTKLSAKGVVVTPEGKPLAGATVYLREWSYLRFKSSPTNEPASDIVAKMITDQSGQFTFTNIVAPTLHEAHLRSQVPYEILVIAPGYAPAWQHLTPPLQQQPLLMQLAKSAEINGVVTDASGKPAAGAVIRLLNIGPLRRHFEGKWPHDDYLYLNDSAVHVETKTDSQGRFKLRDLPEGACVCLEWSFQGISELPVYVAVTDQAQPDLASIAYSSSSQQVTFQPVLHGSVTLRLPPKTEVKGVVLAEDTGKPLPNLDVYFSRRAGKRDKVTTDAQGVFSAMVSLSAGMGIATSGGDKFPEYLHKYTPLTESPSDPLIIKLSRGQLVSGQVTDAETGEAVKNTPILFGIPSQRTTSNEFNWWGGKETNEKGEFRWYVPPGQLKLRVEPRDRTYPSTISEVLEVKRESPLTQVKLTMKRNKNIELVGRILDDQGRPLEGASVALGTISQRGQPRYEVTSGPGGRFAFPVSPKMINGTEWEVTIVHHQLHQGAIYHLDEDNVATAFEKPLEIKLVPLATMTGRVVDPQGKPVRNCRVILTVAIPRKQMIDGILRQVQYGADFPSRETLTDEHGRFTLEDVQPDDGLMYRAQISAKGYSRVTAKQFIIERGEQFDCGEVRLVPCSESIAGIFVDSDGKPVANVQVNASPAWSGEDTILQSNSGLWVTKADGKFILTDLPKGRLNLYWEVLEVGNNNRLKRRSMTPPIGVDAGQQDIRIVVENRK